MQRSDGLSEKNYAEVEFDLDGKNGLLAALERRLKAREHAVIVVAEGAGQKYFDGNGQRETDASGKAIRCDSFCDSN